MTHRLACLILIASLLAPAVAESPPELLHYQGVLRDSAGQPADGSFAMTFRFFDAAVGGDELLVNVPPPVAVDGGLFSVELGSGSVADGSGPGSYDTLSRMFGNFETIWMEIEVGAETLSPRVRVVAAPYALNAGRLDGRIASGYLDTSSDAQSKAGELNVGSLTVDGALRLAGLAPGAGKVLTSDATGQASWETPAADPVTRLVQLAEVAPDDLPASLRSFDCSGANTATLSLTLNGTPTGSVVAFVGRERVSAPYEFLVAFTAPTAMSASAELGKLGRLTLARPGASSTFSGRVSAFGSAGELDGERLFVARIEPRLAELGLSSGYAIYQDFRPTEILEEIVNNASIDFQIDFTDTYIADDMTVQYGESDLDFLDRLAQRSGIHYHFTEIAAGERMVLGDHGGAFATSAGSYDYPGSAAESISSFRAPLQQNTSTARVRGYDLTSPATTIEATSTTAGMGEHYEFYADRVSDSGLAAQLASRQLERELTRIRTYSGSGNAASFRAGHSFTLNDTTGAGIGGSYLLTEVTHFADASDPSCVTYANRFRSTPTSVPFRPARVTPRPVVDGPVTAVVTGPAGETIFTDEFGRVKVQFIWDRQGANDETSSAWLRVVTPAGKGDQQRYRPEIGDEVLVDFMQGDPDQPVVIGSLYNQDHRPPIDDRLTLASGELLLDGSNSLDPRAILFYDDPVGLQQLEWSDPDDAFLFSDDLIAGDVTADGNDFRFGTGARLSSTSSTTLFAVGIDNTDDVLLYAGNSFDDGSLRIFGDSTFDLRSGSGLFTFNNGATGAQTATLDGDGDLQLDGDLQVDGVAAINGSSIEFATGMKLVGTTASTTLQAGDAAGDDLVLRAGVSSSDGEIVLSGTSTTTLRAGSGNFLFASGDTSFTMGLSQYLPSSNGWRFTGANLDLSLGDSALDSVLVPGDLQVSGTKNFVQDHPYREDLSVVYTALEGDEAGTYTRGSGRVVGGEATVELGPTFAWVTHPDVGLTAHVTPRGGRADLWVAEITPERLVVRGSEGAAFDYVVYGLRIGYEQYSVLQPRRLDGRIPAPDHYESFYSAHPDLRAYNAYERFGGASAERGGATELRAAIGHHASSESARSVTAPQRVERSAPTETIEPRREPSAREPLALRTDDGELATAVDIDDEVVAGDLIALDPDDPTRLIAARSAADPTVVGIVAGSPGLVLGGARDASRVPLAFSGIVVARVDAGYGAIRPGDLLTASPTSGHAMRADDPRPGTIVAKALEPLDVGTGTIRVLVMLR